MSWISIGERLPPIRQSILAYGKEGDYYPEVHGEIDPRNTMMVVGYFYDENEYFKKLKPKMKFIIECGCSGYECDRINFEIQYWMPLPNPPISEEVQVESIGGCE